MENTKPLETSRASVEDLMRPQGAAPAAGATESQLHTGMPPQAVEADKLADQIEGLAGDDPIKGKDLRAMIIAIPNIRAMVLATAVRLLGSQRMMFDVSSKTVERVDDGPTQMKAVAFLAAYADGLPMQTTMNLNLDATKEVPLEELLRRSPALLEAVEKQIAKARRVVHQTGSQKLIAALRENQGTG